MSTSTAPTWQDVVGALAAALVTTSGARQGIDFVPSVWSDAHTERTGCRGLVELVRMYLKTSKLRNVSDAQILTLISNGAGGKDGIPRCSLNKGVFYYRGEHVDTDSSSDGSDDEDGETETYHKFSHNAEQNAKAPYAPVRYLDISRLCSRQACRARCCRPPPTTPPPAATIAPCHHRPLLPPRAATTTTTTTTTIPRPLQ